MPIPFCAPTQRNYYLGNPLAKVVQLNLPDSGYSVSLDQARVDHTLLSGYHSIQRVAKIKRSFGLSFSALGVDSADQIVSILAGLLGTGPWYFVDPSWRNVLSSHVSSCGGTLQTNQGFVTSGTSGTVAYSATIAPPAAAPLSGVQVWSTLGNGSQLWLGATAAQLLEATAVPAMKMLPQTFGVWLQSAAGTPNVAIDAYFNDINGAYISSVNVLATTGLTTAWKLVTANLAAASIPAGAQTVGYTIRCLTAATTAINVAAADVQFVTATALTKPAWVLGIATPQVDISGVPPANAASVWWRRNHALTLVECAA